MRGFGFLCLLMLIVTAAFMYHGDSGKGSLSSNPGMVSVGNNAMISVLKSRKLKDNMDPRIPDEDEGHLNLEDYRPIDPVPSSKASIRPGPVQHGTPLMPYIPKPSPSPGKPNHGG
ncbi:Glycosyl hydrolase family 35 protein [Perilla frutescens var. hirtella]|uniref:Glycosyl hydrolase family 35 protein n=1 Tax=Perilla frutescens var. hirtella TaxID=608512 RepID=A0AAD4JGJ9_PERFH|nr:Glycosyl hydrolase family 35 protein [Perilla frutescens var. frutescens]KAH6776303.1 Glycosyl hydrolase family 35 protein [Perilla frutescens var. hirtella]KAH6832743.1 Glycosyl hydrolase family 35 protein [Perilla frutescens var. hirtella]